MRVRRLNIQDSSYCQKGFGLYNKNICYFYFFFLIIYYKVILFYYQIDINEVLFKNDFFDLMIYIVIDVKFDNRINLFLMVIKILE